MYTSLSFVLLLTFHCCLQNVCDCSYSGEGSPSRPGQVVVDFPCISLNFSFGQQLPQSPSLASKSLHSALYCSLQPVLLQACLSGEIACRYSSISYTCDSMGTAVQQLLVKSKAKRRKKHRYRQSGSFHHCRRAHSRWIQRGMI